nr:hypothetical protein [Tanacetum cinerariifolium]
VFSHKIGLIITNLDVIGVIKDEETFGKLFDEDAYDEIKNLKEKHNDEHYFGLKKDCNYVPTYMLSGFVFAFQSTFPGLLLSENNIAFLKLIFKCWRSHAKVLAHDRNDGQAKLQFNDEFSSMSSELCDSLKCVI